MAKLINALDVLKGNEVKPLLSTIALRAALAALSNNAVAAALKTYNNEHKQVTKFNDCLRKQYKDEVSTRKEWRYKDASICKVILATISMHLFKAVRTHVNSY
jgi:superfamily II helicase